MKSYLTLFVVALATSGVAQAQGDVALFKNGDRLTGEIKALDRGRVSFDTPTTGVINLEWDDIARLSSTTTFEITLESGERIYGTLAEATANGQFRVQTPTGMRDLPSQTIVRMTPIKSTLADRIEMRVDLGHSLAKANDLEQTSFGYDFRYRGETRLINFDIDASTSSSESGPSSTRVFSDFNYQRFLEELDWNPVGIGQLERNDELGIDRRVSYGGGMARNLRDTNQSRIGFAGAVVRSFEDDAGSDETTKDTEALVAMNLEWFRYDEPELDVSMAFKLYRRLSGSHEPRGNVDVNVRWEIFKDFFWGVSVYYTYDGQTENEEEASDYGSFTSLAGSFDVEARHADRPLAEAKHASLRHDQVHRDVVRLRMDRLELRVVEADADAKGARHERGERPIVVAAAVAEPESRRVVTDERNQQDVGLHDAPFRRHWDVPEAALHRRSVLPLPELDRRVLRDDDG